jgi:hypothetical protein
MSTQADLAEGSNLWFFVPQEDMRPVLEAYSKWVKENKLEEAVIKVTSGVGWALLLLKASEYVVNDSS